MTDNSSSARVEMFKFWQEPKKIKIVFRKKLRSDSSVGMLAIFQCRIFCFPGCYLKFLRLRHTDIQNYNFSRGFVWVRNLVAQIEGGTYNEGI